MTHDIACHVHDPDPPCAPQKNQFSSSWTDELVEEIRTLWATNSASQIASILNQRGYTFTRSAIVAKLHRLKLTVEDKIAIHPATTFKAEGDDPQRARRIRSRTAKAVQPVPFVCQPLAQVELRHLSLQDLTDQTCKFECSGADHPSAFTFCGNDAVFGKPYCAAHCRVAHLPAQPSRPKGPHYRQGSAA